MEILTEELGISLEVNNLTEELVDEFEELYNSGENRVRLPQAIIRSNSPCFQLRLIKDGNWFNGVVNNIVLDCTIFQNMEDYYSFKQRTDRETPHFNYNEKKVYIPFECVNTDIPFGSIKKQILSVLSHELMHAYQSSKIKRSVGNDLYFKVADILSNGSLFKPGTIEFDVCQLVYFDTLFEIDAQAHNFYHNLEEAKPRDYNEAKAIKPYDWIDFCDYIFNKIMDAIRNDKLKKHFQDALDYLGISKNEFIHLHQYAQKYKKRKFDKIIAYYFSNLNNILESVKKIGIEPLCSLDCLISINSGCLKEKIDYLIKNIF